MAPCRTPFFLMFQKLISNVFQQAFTRSDKFCHVLYKGFSRYGGFEHEFHFQDYFILGFSEANLSSSTICVSVGIWGIMCYLTLLLIRQSSLK